MTPLFAWINMAGTLVAIATSLFLLHQGQKDRRQLREDLRREQARRITTWADWVDSQSAGDVHHPTAAIFVHNASDQVALDVFVDYRDPVRGGDSRIAYGSVPPRTTSRLVILPGDPAAGWEPAAAYPRLYFQDVSGTRWYRTSVGVLQPDHWPRQDEGPVRHLWKDEPQRAALIPSPAER